ncbi:hypothetical protein RHMOL_Rhmol09G0066100 [Rhododendron molle]|uniref:Uncharacterized protein n=1 Tax=Rhododendron molle TaxID=49168 RepID=A0ACC0MBV3_RHOML|nr:hypothetical protein RHMOL_Rhmol09G0066100 [Rhododendron molle]
MRVVAATEQRLSSSCERTRPTDYGKPSIQCFVVVSDNAPFLFPRFIQTIAGHNVRRSIKRKSSNLLLSGYMILACCHIKLFQLLLWRRDYARGAYAGCSGDGATSFLFRREDLSDYALLFELCHEAFHKFSMGLCIESLRRACRTSRASLIKRVLNNFVLDGFSPHPISGAVLEALDVELNEVLMPNPFDRPRAVFMLAVEGVKGSQVMVQSANTLFGTALGTGAHGIKRFDLFFNKVISLIFNFQVLEYSYDAQVKLVRVYVFVSYEFSVVFLNELLSADADMELTEKEIIDLASWLGGTYVAKALEPMTEELTIPLASGASIKSKSSYVKELPMAIACASTIDTIISGLQPQAVAHNCNKIPSVLSTPSFQWQQELAF